LVPVRWHRAGVQQPVEFGDPFVEAGQFVGALDGVGGVGVVADGTAVVAESALQPVPAFLQPGQLGRDAIACLTGKPRGLDVFTQFWSTCPGGSCRQYIPVPCGERAYIDGSSGNALSNKTCVEFSKMYMCLIKSSWVATSVEVRVAQFVREFADPARKVFNSSIFAMNRCHRVS